MSPWSKLLTTEVDGAQLDDGWQRIRARRGRARAARGVFVVGGPLVMLAVVVLVVLGLRERELAPIALAGGAPLPAEWAPLVPEVVAFDDHSRVAIEPRARLRARAAEPSHVALVLDRGRATFDVTPGGPRTWVIEADGVTVRVLGTRFAVLCEDGVVEVSVERGKVSVEGARVADGARVLVAGQSLVIGREAVATDEPQTAPSSTTAPDAPPSTPDARRSPPPEARPRSARVERAALTADSHDAPPTVDTMAIADRARRDGRPHEAVGYLEALVDAKDPRASLAAFTLGKIHMDELGDPARAGAWFERAIALDLPSGLDEEAHARAVESYARAGRRDDAARAAARYASKFPNGRHLQRVRGWSGG